MLSKKVYNIHNMILYLCKCVPFYVLGIFIFMIIEALLPAIQTLAVAGFVDVVTAYLSETVTMREVLCAIGFIIICQFGVILLPILSGMVASVAKQKLNLTLQAELVHKRSCLEYWHVENNDSWDLVNRISEDPSARVMDVFFNVMNIGSLMITIVSVLAIVMKSSPVAGLAIVTVSVPFYRIAMCMGKSNYDMHREEKKIKRRYQYLGDILTQRETVEERNLFSFSEAVAKEYDRLFKKSYQIEKKIQKKSFVNLKSGSIITLFVAMLIIGSLCPSLLKGKISLGLLIALTTAIINLVQSMSWQLSDTMFALAQSKEFCNDFTAFMAMEEKEGADELPVERHQMRVASIEFRDVSFSYPGTGKSILNHCSFKLERGMNYALVGENGAGKTTIIKLLLGLYENYTGQILINDRDIKHYPYGEIKGLFSTVSQDFARYELTIRENVLLGDVCTRDEKRLQEALKNSQMWQIIESLPDGIDTNLGRLREQGRDLSSGQWQRLAIARLLYASAQVNILDEPTAAMDPLQESAIYRMFQKISEDFFAIFITHRLGAARVADCIFVVKDGKIAECGSHEDLMQIENGSYRKMYEAQRAWYE